MTGAFAFNRRLQNAHALAHDDALYASGRSVSWAGTLDSVNYGPVINGAGELLACAVRGDDIRSLVVNNGLPQNELPTDPDHTVARLERPHDANVLRSMGLTYSVNEVAVGAIDGSGQTVLALPSGRLVVLSPEGDPEDDARDHRTGRGDRQGRDGPERGPPVRDRPLRRRRRRRARPATQRRRDRDAGRRAKGRRLARVARVAPLRRDPARARRQRPRLPRGQGYRGAGPDGRTLWSVASAVQLRAAAFADGTLAVVRGRDVQIVGRDGAIRQSFRAAEELTTYPAIAADGIWVASAKTLYAAR